MKDYIKPELEIILFESPDVITGSTDMDEFDDEDAP